MAEINVGVQKTNDPSYLGNSQGTDRASLQPLASVPELSTKVTTPDYQANRSTGKALEGLGSLAEAALKLTDAVIQRKADDTLTQGIQKIRDEFGVGDASANGGNLGKAVGQQGAEGVSLTNAEGPATPVAVNRLGNRIDGLTESYKQGGLSNSAYYAKMEAFVRETKAQFPGYANEIDGMVATKVGTTPANALRNALLQDVTALQSKVQGLNDKWTTYERQNASDIYQIWPNYDQIKNTLPRATVEAEVGRKQAQMARLDANTKSLAALKAGQEAQSEQALGTAMEWGSHFSRTAIVGVTNSMGIQSTDDLRKYIIDVQTGKRPMPTPDEQQQINGLFSTLEQQVAAKFNAKMNEPIGQNTTQTIASILRNGGKLDQARELALSDIKALKEALYNEQHGIAAATVQYNKAVDATADKKLATAVPNSVVAGAVRRKIGDNALGNLIIDSQSGMGGDLMAGLRQAGWTSLDQKTPVMQTMGTLSKDDPSGASSRQHIRDAARFVVEQDKLMDKSLGDNSFQSLFGPGNRTLVDAFNSNPKAQITVFSDMVNSQMTNAVKKRSAQDQKMYSNWAEDSFTSVFQTQANGVNTSANSYKISGNLTLEFNPETNNFSYKGGRSAPQGIVNNANAKLEPLNSAINTMKDVNKLTGRNTTEFLHEKLVVMGIEPGSPLYKALDDQVRKLEAEKDGKK
jgi:hypothetical protein